MAAPDRFIRLPTKVFEEILSKRLSGAQWRIIFWVIRHTYGWNRPSAPFTWYRIAKDVGMSRPALYRSGQNLLARGILVVREGQLAIEIESVANRQLPIPGLDVASEPRFPSPESNAPVAAKQPERCRQATVFRRAKDSSKDRLKTYKDMRSHRTAVPHRGDRDHTERRHLAGEAKPVPRKYDSVSEN